MRTASVLTVALLALAGCSSAPPKALTPTPTGIRYKYEGDQLEPATAPRRDGRLSFATSASRTGSTSPCSAATDALRRWPPEDQVTAAGAGLVAAPPNMSSATTSRTVSRSRR